MANNLMWIQNEKVTGDEYLFFNDQLLSAADFKEIEILRVKLFQQKRRIIWSSNNGSQEEVARLDCGYYVSGLLEDKDELGRNMVFMTYLEGEDINVNRNFIINSLNVISKNISDSYLEFALNKINKHKNRFTIKNILPYVLIIILLFSILTILYY